MVTKNFRLRAILLAALLAVCQTARSAKIALYEGPGTGGNGPPELVQQFKGIITQVSPEQIQHGVLTNYDVVIFGGGSGSKQAEALGESGRAEVQKFVGQGGGYIGICGGAYLATSGYSWSLHLINAKTLSSKWRRGHAVLKMELTQPGQEILGGDKTNLEVLYHNGPVVGPARAEGLPEYGVLAWFREEVASNDAPKGIMLDSPAIISAPYKQGKVICISPHPEQTPGLEYLVSRAVKWVTPDQSGKLTGTIGEIMPSGLRLIQTLDAMHVDQLWLAGKQVDWRTGQPNGKVYAMPNGHTHCSAFAAAAAERLGIYLLRPPEHSAVLLANAQQDWLCGAGTNQGWFVVNSPLQAQQLANAGDLVVVTCKNPDPKHPGHIAIVRPSTKSEAKILEEGPEITQAGLHNYVDGAAREGFKNHPGAFEKRELLYFAHAVPSSSAGIGTGADNVSRN